MTRRDRRKAQTRETLVANAARLFAERGVAATTMDDIAAAAGVSRTSVFNYFGYKEAILVEIGAGFVQEIAAAAARYQRRSPRQALYDLADAISAIAERDPQLISAVAHEMMHPDAARRHAALERMQYPMLIEGMLADLAAGGKLRHARRVTSHVRQLVDLAAGTLVRVASDMPIPQLRVELRANVDLFCDGAMRDGAA
ncbi:MAG: helix-turn-helix domain-containing protein [Chloroflexota bacterium]